MYIFLWTVLVTSPRLHQSYYDFDSPEPCSTHQYLHATWSTFSDPFHTISFTMQSHDQNSILSLTRHVIIMISLSITTQGSVHGEWPSERWRHGIPRPEPVDVPVHQCDRVGGSTCQESTQDQHATAIGWWDNISNFKSIQILYSHMKCCRL